MTETRDLFPRSSGILLHPTSLPGGHGIGDLGAEAHRFVDWLADAGQSLWQILPLGPTSYGDSPYQTLSALAGNPLLISLDRLVQDGLLEAGDLAVRPDFPVDRVDFGAVIQWKLPRLDQAWERFAAEGEHADYEAFRAEQAGWLDDFALFMALKEEHDDRCWVDWPPELAQRQPAALATAHQRLQDRVGAHAFRQWLFARQWQALREHARDRGVRLMGDLPIFVAYDSCDVWARPDLYHLGDDLRPTVVAGVPPDYFSETGQLWGNPLYDWEAMARDGYRWWIDRMRACLAQTDLVRIDHFRGFEAYWEVPADEETAIHGRWVDGPRDAFFAALRAELGGLPIVAEDLGIITEEVELLRDRVGLPGMKVLQFAFSGPKSPFLPHNYPHNCVVYSGTHDNDPTVGWWREACDEATRDQVRDYLGRDVDAPHWALIRLGMQSVGHTFVAPMQDVLGLGREARMNRPGDGGGNWNWRLATAGLADGARDHLAHLTWLYRRRPDQRTSLYEDDRRRQAASGE